MYSTGTPEVGRVSAFRGNTILHSDRGQKSSWSPAVEEGAGDGATTGSDSTVVVVLLAGSDPWVGRAGVAALDPDPAGA